MPTYACCPSIDAVLNQFFDNRAKVDYNLAGLDLMNLGKLV